MKVKLKNKKTDFGAVSHMGVTRIILVHLSGPAAVPGEQTHFICPSCY